MSTLHHLPPALLHGARPAHVRETNLMVIVDRLARVGPTSRADLARGLGLSATSVGRLVEELLHQGLVVEGERIVTGVGRPQTLVQLHAGAASVAGVSIRSRWVRVRLADLDGHVIASADEERRDDSAEALGHQVAAIVARLRAGARSTEPLAAVVVGISGAWDAAQRRVLAAPNLPMLEGVDALAAFHAALADPLGDGSIALDNDVNLAAIGERTFGAARGVDDVFYLSVGSGVGGAAIVAGAVHRGASGLVGEVGYLPVTVGGREVRLEHALGRSALESVANGLGIRTDGDVLGWLERDEPENQQLTEYVAGVLAQALVAVVTTIDPRLVVLGGSVGRYGRAWTERTRERLAERVPTVPAIASTQLGREAPLLGAIESARALAHGALVAGAVTPTGARSAEAR